jgi:hypothetical protein
MAMSRAARTMTDALVAVTSARGHGRIGKIGGWICMAANFRRPAVPIAHATNPIDTATMSAAFAARLV